MSQRMRLAAYACVALMLACQSVLAQAPTYEETIPPEIVRLYDPGIVHGARPKVVSITQPVIWLLREKPDQGGEVYVLDINFEKLSTVQRNVLINWIEKGMKVVLWGREPIDTIPYLVPGAAVGWSQAGEACELTDHVVNTDCRLLRFECDDSANPYRGLGQAPAKCEVIAGTKSVVVAGRIPVGLGSIYFAALDPSEKGRWQEGADRDRWTLNFKQWMMDLPVPGAAETRVAETAPPAVYMGTKDRILLKNGDVVSGTLATQEFRITTDYADLTFPRGSLWSLFLDAGGRNYEVMILRNGDRLSGLTQPVTVRIKLELNEEIEIAKTKIKEIVVGQ